MRGGAAILTEDTIVRISSLPDGQDWAWHPDINVVELSDRLRPAARERALEDLSSHWRKHCIRAAPNMARTA